MLPQKSRQGPPPSVQALEAIAVTKTSPAADDMSRICAFTKDVHSDYKGVVEIRVGKDEEEVFKVHQDLLTARSIFFKTALSGNWKEALERHVVLPEDDPSTFKKYIHLLYTGKLAIIPNLTPSIETIGEEFDALAHLYVLAEKLLDTETKKTVLKAMLAASRVPRLDGTIFSPGFTTIEIIYEGTSAGSPMRKVLVDLYVYRAHRDSVTSFGNDKVYPLEFYQELTRAFVLTRAETAANGPLRDASSYMEEEDVDAAQ
ncbi:hypothetical protein IAQ61_010516 [Plenodomus lingam]|uniref:BTB domain-containing protein n=1 Tax=Leptosphaeria maculans (strain JN3 / isolate v23.1.3 / race Av1-4-5-6-7-8) TaxID=985895 RepID=E5A479_LEPMJ|nr:hypothetical protein LEMA_P098330.1 [Plenodomus lingam JN3]KAH9862313.1 hypothetical protein IAQ61_010516 [Plenodomus lingam]CBX98424.1 hypothetical protein LEMA_P098330.1 [Plenodomus lingam JN3]